MKTLARVMHWVKSGFKKSIVADCGHFTPLEGTVKAFGETRNFRLGSVEEKVPYCIQCLKKMIIRCAWCGKPIFPADPITLYMPRESYNIPSYAIFYSEKPVRLVGCLRWNCADTGADRAGFWLPPGVIFRALSPAELALIKSLKEKEEKVLSSVVVVNDVSSIEEALKLAGHHG